MRKRCAPLVVVVWIFVAGRVWATDPPAFEDFFIDATLRVDIVHSGTNDHQDVSMRRVLREPVWGGPTSHLVPAWDAGMFRFDLVDPASQTVIFRKGFSSLFGEWQTTAEADGASRAFEGTLEAPFPKKPVDLVVYARNRKGGMDRVFDIAIDPGSHRIEEAPDASNVEVIDMEIHGAAADKVDVLVLADGYAEDDRGKFEGDCRRFLDKLFGEDPFKSRRRRFNVRAIFVASSDSGIDEPRKGVFVDTPFGMTFSMFDLPRYCMTDEYWAIHDAARAVPHDAILLMANSSRYGGGAIYNYYTAFVSDNEYDDYLTLHEFGHGFAGLGDEYYTSSVAYNEFYPRGVEPWEPNLTALLEPRNLKWKRFVEAGTPLPTRAEDARFASRVGAFEGAGYAAKGLYRPQKDCKMFSKAHRPFCRVCEAAIIEMIDWYAPEGE